MSSFRDHSNCVFAPFFSTGLCADPTEKQQKEVSFLARVFASMNRLTSLSLQRTVRVQMVKLLLSVTFLRSLLPWLSHGRRSCPRNLQRKQVSPTDLFNSTEVCQLSLLNRSNHCFYFLDRRKEVSSLAKVFASMNRLTSLSLQRTVCQSSMKVGNILTCLLTRFLLTRHWYSCVGDVQRKQVRSFYCCASVAVRDMNMAI